MTDIGPTELVTATTVKEAVEAMLDISRSITPNTLENRVTTIMAETQEIIITSQAFSVITTIVEECAKVAEANKADPAIVQAIRDLVPTKGS